MADLTPTYYNIGDFKGTGVSQGDTVKAIYNLWKAVVAICNNIDEDTGNTGTDYMTDIGTDLNTAMTNFKTPSGVTT
jgi:hypothetical protein